MEEKKIYIKNERFMEFIDELATEMTEMTYGVSAFDDSDSETVELAQDFYNEKYDQIEYMANNMILLYSDNDLNK
jgi:hypothetical protein